MQEVEPIAPIGQRGCAAIPEEAGTSLIPQNLRRQYLEQEGRAVLSQGTTTRCTALYRKSAYNPRETQ